MLAKYEKLRTDLAEEGTGKMKVFGQSMKPIIESGSLLTFEKCEDPNVGDVVFCKVKGRIIDAHKVTAKNEKRGWKISNNHGFDNGWTKTIYAKVIEIEGIPFKGGKKKTSAKKSTVIKHTRVPTFQATIFCGLRHGYADKVNDIKIVEELCSDFCASGKCGLTLTKTKFFYKGGNEDGVAIGLINYPRYPEEESMIRDKALHLATILKEKLNQERVSVVMTDQTIMLGDL
jgi:hypothetical protein